MLKSEEIRRQVAQRLRELLPKAKSWEEQTDVKIAGHAAGLVVRFRLVDQEHTVVLEVASLGQPRQIRAAVTRLADIRRELPGAYPVAAAVYIGPQSARILKSHNLGYVDLSGNCSLAFENVLIEKDGKRNVRPSTRPLRSLFAPRATRRRSPPRSGSARQPKGTAPCTSSRPTTPASSTPCWRRAGSRWCVCHSSTPTFCATSGGGVSRPSTSVARRWATDGAGAVNPRTRGGETRDEEEGDEEKEEEVSVAGLRWGVAASHQVPIGRGRRPLPFVRVLK